MDEIDEKKQNNLILTNYLNGESTSFAMIV